MSRNDAPHPLVPSTARSSQHPHGNSYPSALFLSTPEELNQEVTVRPMTANQGQICGPEGCLDPVDQADNWIQGPNADGQEDTLGGGRSFELFTRTMLGM